jgi:hypothetical protein
VLGANPIQHLLESTGVLATLPPASRQTLTGTQFFPHLISGPFHHGLVIVFTTAALLSLVAAAASMLRGARPTGAEATNRGAPVQPRRRVRRKHNATRTGQKKATEARSTSEHSGGH